jgi:hypothetical protein
MRSERISAAGSVDDDLFGMSTAGLFLVDTGELVVVAASRLAADFRHPTDRTKFSVVRGWSNGAGNLNGSEKWSVDVPGRSFPTIRRMQPVTFDGLRVAAYVNPDRTTARADLEASSVRSVAASPIESAPFSRARREPVTVPASTELTEGQS